LKVSTAHIINTKHVIFVKNLRLDTIKIDNYIGNNKTVFKI